MKNQKINLTLMFVTLFLGLGSFFPFNSIYLQETLKFNGEQIGLFYSVSALIVAVSVPLFGMLADKIKSPRNVYAFCALATVVFLVPYTFVKPFFLITVLYVFINGIRSALIPLIDSIAIDYSYKHQNNYGIFRSVGSLSFIVSSIFTGFLLEKFPQNGALFLYVHITFMILTMYFALRQENVFSETSKSTNFKEDIIDLFKNKQYLLVILIMGIANGIIQVAQAYISLAIIELGGSSDIVGISFLFLVLPEVIFFSVVLKFTKKIPHIYLMLIGVLYLLFRWLILLKFKSIPILLLVSTSHGVVMAFVVLVGIDLIRSLVKPNLISSAIAVYTGLANVVFSIISFIAGKVMIDGSVYNTYFLYTFTTILAIIGIIVYIVIFQRRPKYE